jgi:hypothetical protein
MSDSENQPELTPEQIKEYRKMRLAYYNEEMPMLKQQLAYETIVANIEEQRLKRMSYIMKMAQMSAPPLEEKTEGPKEQVTPKSE